MRKEATDRLLKDAKDAYAIAFSEVKCSEVQEALAIGIDHTTVSSYMNPEIDRHMPFGLLVKSKAGDGVVQWLASQRGGEFLKLEGDLNGSPHDEMVSIVKEVSKYIKALAEGGDIRPIIAKVARLAVKADKEANG